MSELEKIRAVRLLSVIGVALVALFVVRGIDPDTVLPARDALEICAVSKGALCEDAAVATLGSITVVATRLPADRFAQLDTLHREAAALTDPDNFEAAHVFAF